jgi:hypothetical protein
MTMSKDDKATGSDQARTSRTDVFKEGQQVVPNHRPVNVVTPPPDRKPPVPPKR